MINNFSRAGSGRIVFKYAADNICFFFMHNEFLIS